MSSIAIRPVGGPVHRYTAAEMCGPLPSVLYKVLSTQYARRLVDAGELMWSTLAWFQHYEEQQRGDSLEGAAIYFPPEGLQVHRKMRDGGPDDTRFTLPDHGLVSRTARSHHIFIYSTTLDAALHIGDSSRRACVEIFDPFRFANRIRMALRGHRKARPETFIYDAVHYRTPEDLLNETWELPDRLVMNKSKAFEPQQEYRFAFGIRAGVFDFENVDPKIVRKGEADKAPRSPLAITIASDAVATRFAGRLLPRAVSPVDAARGLLVCARQ